MKGSFFKSNFFHCSSSKLTVTRLRLWAILSIASNKCARLAGDARKSRFIFFNFFNLCRFTDSDFNFFVFELDFQGINEIHI
ncbi:hypothetical protein BGP_5069 [Beggiatoa sp. PS]|nr:hypothetical protein BGP_5069 [Beggiatoa sp. PS]